MEYEKIKIYVTKRVAEILEKDAETFEFLKSDNITPNKNAFLSTLIKNYWLQYRKEQSELNSSIQTILKENTTLPELKIQDISSLIIAKFNKDTASNIIDKFDSIVSFKPTKETQSIVDYIDEYMLQNISLSEYFRNMFTAYTTLPQDMRAEVVFRTQYEALSDAIKNAKTVFITLKNDKQTKMEIEPFAFTRSKEEIHTYLLYKQTNACRSMKLYKIQSVVALDKKTNFSPNEISLFNKMRTYGPQFFYEFNEQDVVVRLTKRGQQLYHKIYIHRPIPAKIENDIFTFKCSYIQIVQYFSRFGGEVEIISPNRVKDMIFTFHNSYIIKNKIDNSN